MNAIKLFSLSLIIIVSALLTGCSGGISNPVDADPTNAGVDLPRDQEWYDPDIELEVTPASYPIKIDSATGGMADFHIKVKNNEGWTSLPAKGWIVGIAPWGKKYWPDTPYIPCPIQLFFSAYQEFHYDWSFEVPPGLPPGLYQVQVNIGYYLCKSWCKAYATDTFCIKILP